MPPACRNGCSSVLSVGAAWAARPQAGRGSPSLRHKLGLLRNRFACARRLSRPIHPLFNACLQRRGTDGAVPLTFLEVLTLLPLLLGVAPGGLTVRSITVEDQIIMRIPVRPPPPQVEWTEHKGPKCIDAEKIRGAFLSGSDHVDFVLSGKKLLRAELEENCPALDFYNGFYLSSSDDKVCARRDVVRSRMGASCGIERFRELKGKIRH